MTYCDRLTARRNTRRASLSTVVGNLAVVPRQQYSKARKTRCVGNIESADWFPPALRELSKSVCQILRNLDVVCTYDMRMSQCKSMDRKSQCPACVSLRDILPGVPIEICVTEPTSFDKSDAPPVTNCLSKATFCHIDIEIHLEAVSEEPGIQASGLSAQQHLEVHLKFRQCTLYLKSRDDALHATLSGMFRNFHHRGFRIRIFECPELLDLKADPLSATALREGINEGNVGARVLHAIVFCLIFLTMHCCPQKGKVRGYDIAIRVFGISCGQCCGEIRQHGCFEVLYSCLTLTL